MYWIKPIRIIFLNGLVFIHMKLWLCIYEIIPLLVSIHLLIMMQYDAIGTTYSNTPPRAKRGWDSKLWWWWRLDDADPTWIASSASSTL